MSFVNIDPRLAAEFRLGVKNLIAANSRPCLLEYPPINVPCPNPVHSESRSSQEFYLSGGRFSSLGNCQDCGGSATIAQVQTEMIYMEINWSPHDWYESEPTDVEVRIPYSIITARGMMDDYPKIQRCNRMIVNPPMEGTQKYSYALAGEPIDKNNLLSRSFFMSVWKRS